jgi:hypothetical protein
MAKPTEQELDAYLNRLKEKDPNFDLNVEFGMMLLKHINRFTPNELKRCNELKLLLSVGDQSPNAVA